MNEQDVQLMLNSQDVWEITYGTHRIRIMDIVESSKYPHLLSVYCLDWNKEIKLNKSKIETSRRYWVNILAEDETAPKSGLYVFACRGDNHIINEMFWLNKGELLWKYFEGEYGHMNGWFRVIPLAYHYVESFVANGDTGQIWETNHIADEYKDARKEFLLVFNKQPTIKETDYYSPFYPIFAKGATDDNGLFYFLSFKPSCNGTELMACDDAIVATYEINEFSEAAHGFWRYVKSLKEQAEQP